MSDTSVEARIDRDLIRLSNELEKLNQHRFIQVHNSLPRLVLFQFLRGLAFGLGTVIGASALVSILVLMLNQIEVVPIIGDFATRIIEEIDTTQ